MSVRHQILKLFCVLTIASMVQAACAPAPTAAPAASAPTAAPAEPAAAAAPVEPSGKPSGKLLIWVQKANQDVFEKTVLDDFKAEFPDVQLEFVNYSPSEVANQVALAIQAGAGLPDLAITENASIGRLIELGGLLDLTEWMRPYLDKLNKPVLEGASKDGKYYCMPWDIGPVVLFYRRDILKAAGLSDDPEEVSKLAATWDDFLGMCKTIKEETGFNCFANNKANNYGDLYFNMLWQQGLGFYAADNAITVNNPENVATLEKFGEFWEADLVSDQLEWTDGWYAELNAPMDDPNVKPVATIPIAAWMGNFLKTWVAADRSGDWGVAEMPAFTAGGVRSANQGGSCFFIPEASTNKEAAWAFTEFMVGRTDNHVKIFEFSDYFPALESTYDDPIFQEPDEYFGGQPTRMTYAKAAQAIPSANLYGPYAQAMRGAVATAVQKFALGQATAQEVLDEAADAIRTETGLP